MSEKLSIPRKSFFADELSVQVYNSRQELGKAAADSLASVIISMLEQQQEVNIVFAAAPSQTEFLEALKVQKNISWDRINAFHMDEYIGIAPGAPQSFGIWLKQRLFERIPFSTVHYIEPFDPENECTRYSALLEKYPTDIVCLGIGENGHLAFNDPPVADFEDPHLVKKVELDHACRQQQVNDGCFQSLELVPTEALTLTIPALFSAKYISCVVPGSTKKNAVRETLTGPVSTSCPASILRNHSNAVLYLDQDAYGETA